MLIKLARRCRHNIPQNRFMMNALLAAVSNYKRLAAASVPELGVALFVGRC